MPKVAHIRDTTLSLSAPLLEWMEAVWGCILSYVKTRTDTETGEVWIGKAADGGPGATALRRVGAAGRPRRPGSDPAG